METSAPVSYRIQLRDSIDFPAVIELLPYLKNLGITHLYLSPIFKAPESSTHGYDIADPTSICESIGGIETFRRLAVSSKQMGLKIILDIVPNHMSADPKANLWWRDVLEKGSWSFFEDFFDIYWTELSQIPYRDKIVLPILGEPLIQIIDSRQLSLEWTGGSFQLSYFDQKIPINLQGIFELLKEVPQKHELLDPIIQSLKKLKPKSLNRFFVSKESFHDYHLNITQSLQNFYRENSEICASWQDYWNEPARYDELIRNVLDQQYYKLVWWKNGRYLVNYRRFFTISDLIAIKEEKYDVFQRSHELIFDLYEQELIDGLRVDHPDGLSQPTLYFQDLRQACPNALILAEKILESHEELPNWPIDGTTGYDFLADINAFFVLKDFESKFTNFYAEFIQEHDDYNLMVKEQKKRLLQGDLNADFQRIVRLFYDLVYTNRSTTDHSVGDCETFLAEIVCSLQVYRTYLRIGQSEEIQQQSIHYWQDALSRIPQNKLRLTSLAHYFQALIHDDLRTPAEQTFLDYLQKLTSPVTAKAVEDQVFYSYNRMVLLNEVGSDPMRFGINIDEFHQRQMKRNKKWPKSLLATSTHDTKRSEDVRARLAVISEIPDMWMQKVQAWQELKQRVDPEAMVDLRTSYFMYQNLVGCWPIDLQRFQEFMIKSAREADIQTSWRSPNIEFEKHLNEVIEKLYDLREFTESVQSFVEHIAPFGFLNSLNQTLIKLTSPGIPDIYQGCETYQFSLVDPDNRRKVDYPSLSKLLEHCKNPQFNSHNHELGKPLTKLKLVQMVLKTRQEYWQAFQAGSRYQALQIDNCDNPAIMGYLRGNDVCVITSRFPYRYREPAKNASIHLPEGEWYDLINHKKISSQPYPLKTVWQHFPASFIVKTKTRGSR
ncbi:MAG: malto-oligosyltrehalose synthase [Oligoflexus sp.]